VSLLFLRMRGDPVSTRRRTIASESGDRRANLWSGVDRYGARVSWLGCDLAQFQRFASLSASGQGPTAGGFSACASSAILFDLPIGIVVFAISPVLASGHWTEARLRGLFLGLFGYAVYDLTNQATLRDWPVAVTAADLLWGSLLTAVAAIAGLMAARAFGTPG
jgi:uncharacterized membrane protein